MVFWKSHSKHRQLVEPAAKRISTPAGQRLSIILESGDAQQHSRPAHRASMGKAGGLVTATAVVGEAPRANGGTFTSYVWSDGEKLNILKNHEQIVKRGGWKRVLMILAVLMACIIALAVGLAVGLKKNGTASSDAQSQSPSDLQTSPSNTKTETSTGTYTDSATPTSTLSPIVHAANFPTGSYSFVTFLDTVLTGCTSLNTTWSCYPYTDFNTDSSASVATFNWRITTSSSSTSSSPVYQISSTEETPFSNAFTNATLTLLDAGKDTERYNFHFHSKKTVGNLTSTLTLSEFAEEGDGSGEAECAFADTYLNAWLYTRMARTYPDTEHGQPDGNPLFEDWPYAVKVEQSAGGGQDVPSCRKLGTDGKVTGGLITKGITAMGASEACSCLYRNWRTTVAM